MKSYLLYILVTFISISTTFSQNCLIADYPLDNNANDVSGNNYHGVVSGATLTEDRLGNPNSAYLFDGNTTTNITLNNNNPIIDSTFFTVCAWARMDGLGGGLDNVNQLFLQRANAAINTATIGLKAENVNGNIEFAIRTPGNSAELVEYPALTYGSWNHYAGVCTGDSLKLYINGNLVNSVPFTQAGGDVTSIDFVEIGRQHFNNRIQGVLNGAIDDVQIFNCALTDSEINDLYNPAQQQNCLIAEYPLDNNANDVSGNNYHGVVSGATLTEDRLGNPNSAYLFNNTNDYIEINNNNPVIDTTYFSISAWARMDGKGNGTGENNQIFTQRNNGTINTSAISLSAENKFGKAFFGIRTNGNTVESAETNSIPSYGSWNHYVGVCTGDSLYLYINGALVAASLFSQAGGDVTSIDFVEIGREFYNSGVRSSFNGAIDDVQIFNCALSASEVNDLYNPVQQQNCLIAEYPLDNNANDLSGNNYHGVVTGATLTEDRLGNPNSAYLFNNTNDYIEINNNNPVIDTTYFSISAWARMDGKGNGTGENNQIFTQRNNGTINTSAISLSAENKFGRAFFGIRTNGNTVESAETNSVPSYGSWNHYVGVCTGDSLYLYINGQLVAASLFSQAGGDVTSIDFVEIGREFYNSGVRSSFNGAIDDVQIFNCALSASEVNDLYIPVQQQQCLTALYPLDNNANDISGNNYHGVVYGATLTDDRLSNPNSAYLFDADVNKSIVLNNNNPVIDSTFFTVCAWARMDGLGGGLDNVNQLFLQRANAAINTATIGLKAENVNGNIEFGIRTPGNSTELVEYPALTYGSWNHYAGVCTGDSLKLYVNGNLVNSVPFTQAGGDVTSIDFVEIGRQHFNNKIQGAFNGAIDDVQIYNCALSDSEIYDRFYTSIDNVNNQFLNINVYPNPTSGKIYIRGLENKTYNLSLFNTIGQNLVISSNPDNSIDISEIEPGVYFLMISSIENETFVIKKVIKQ